MYFRSNRNKVRFQKKKMKSGKTLWTTGYKLNTYKGSFAKLQGEGVSFDMGRQIRFRQLRSD